MFPDVVPHLTIAQTAPPGVLLDMAERVRAGLPVAFRVSEAILITLSGDGGWGIARRYPLATEA